jgi:hypothetical protein
VCVPVFVSVYVPRGVISNLRIGNTASVRGIWKYICTYCMRPVLTDAGEQSSEIDIPPLSGQWQGHDRPSYSRLS